MNQITETRTLLAAVLGEHIGEVQDILVLMGVTELTPKAMGGKPLEEVKYTVRIIVGDETPESLERVDDLVEDVPKVLGESELQVFVTHCSGHRTYGRPNSPPQIGCEWSLKVL